MTVNEAVQKYRAAANSARNACLAFLEAEKQLDQCNLRMKEACAEKEQVEKDLITAIMSTS